MWKNEISISQILVWFSICQSLQRHMSVCSISPTLIIAMRCRLPLPLSLLCNSSASSCSSSIDTSRSDLKMSSSTRHTISILFIRMQIFSWKSFCCFISSMSRRIDSNPSTIEMTKDDDSPLHRSSVWWLFRFFTFQWNKNSINFFNFYSSFGRSNHHRWCRMRVETEISFVLIITRQSRTTTNLVVWHSKGTRPFSPSMFSADWTTVKWRRKFLFQIFAD